MVSVELSASSAYYAGEGGKYDTSVSYAEAQVACSATAADSDDTAASESASSYYDATWSSLSTSQSLFAMYEEAEVFPSGDDVNIAPALNSNQLAYDTSVNQIWVAAEAATIEAVGTYNATTSEEGQDYDDAMANLENTWEVANAGATADDQAVTLNAFDDQELADTGACSVLADTMATVNAQQAISDDNASQTQTIDNTSAEVAFDSAEMSSYSGAISAWASDQGTASGSAIWATYVLAQVDAESVYMASTDADMLADTISDVDNDTKAAENAISDDQDQTIEQDADEIALARSIISADKERNNALAIAAVGSLSHSAVAQGAEESQFASIENQWEDQLTDEYGVLGNAYNQALSVEAVALASNNIFGGSNVATASAIAQTFYSTCADIADAEQNALGDDRLDDYGPAFTGAQAALASAIAGDMTQYAQNQANANDAFATAEAGALLTYNTGLANSESIADNAIAASNLGDTDGDDQADDDDTDQDASAESLYDIALADAQNTYDTSIADQYASEMESWATSTAMTPEATYMAALASASAIWQHGVTGALATQASSDGAAGLSDTESDAGDDETLANAEAQDNYEYALALDADVDQADIADAQAASTSAVGSTSYNNLFSYSMAEARSVDLIAVAGATDGDEMVSASAGGAWFSAYADAASAFTDSENTDQTDYNNAMSLASTEESASFSAGDLTSATTVNDAIVAYYDQAGQASQSLAGNMASLDETYQSQFASADDAQSEADGQAADGEALQFASAETEDADADAENDEDLADSTDSDQDTESDAEAAANSTLAIATAEADANYQIAVADIAATSAAETAALDATLPNTFASQYAAASASWVTAISGAFVTMSATEATDQYNDNTSDDSDDETYENALAVDEYNDSTATAKNDDDDAAADTDADNALSIAQVQAAGVFNVATAEANDLSASAAVDGEVSAADDYAQATASYSINMAEHESTEAAYAEENSFNALAGLDLATGQALANKDWSTSYVDASVGFSVSQALASVQDAEADGENDSQDGNEDAEAAYDQATADATAAHNDSSLDAANDDVTLGDAEFTAQAVFDDAQDAAEATAMESLSATMVSGTSNPAIEELAAYLVAQAAAQNNSAAKSTLDGDLESYGNSIDADQETADMAYATATQTDTDQDADAQYEATESVDNAELTEETGLLNASAMYTQAVVPAIESYGQETADDYYDNAIGVADASYSNSLTPGLGLTNDFDLTSALAQAQTDYANAEINPDATEQETVAQTNLAATNAINAVMETYEQDTDGYDATFSEAVASQQYNLSTLVAQAQETYFASSAAEYQTEIDAASISSNPFAAEASTFAAALYTETQSIAGAAETDALAQANLTYTQASATATAQQSLSDSQADQSVESDEASAQQAFNQAMAQAGVDREDAAEGGYQPVLPQLPTATNSVGSATSYDMINATGLNGEFGANAANFSSVTDLRIVVAPFFSYDNDYNWYVGYDITWAGETATLAGALGQWETWYGAGYWSSLTGGETIAEREGFDQSYVGTASFNFASSGWYNAPVVAPVNPSAGNAAVTLPEVDICFAAGTLVIAKRTATAESELLPIERLLPGQQVLCSPDRDPHAPPEWRAIELVRHNPPGRLLSVHLGSGVIRATGNHPFWTVNRGWTRADKLAVDDLLLSHAGKPVPVTDLFDNDDVEPVFNLEVADYHTYFVATPDGKHSVLVHNECDATAANVAEEAPLALQNPVLLAGITSLQASSNDEPARAAAGEIVGAYEAWAAGIEQQLPLMPVQIMVGTLPDFLIAGPVNAPPGFITVYRGDLEGATQFVSKAANIGGLAASRAILDTGDIRNLQMMHSAEPPSINSPLISTTASPQIARYFATNGGTRTGVVYTLRMPESLLTQNPNSLNVPAGPNGLLLSEAEYYAANLIQSDWIAGGQKIIVDQGGTRTLGFAPNPNSAVGLTAGGKVIATAKAAGATGGLMLVEASAYVANDFTDGWFTDAEGNPIGIMDATVGGSPTQMLDNAFRIIGAPPHYFYNNFGWLDGR